MLALAGLFTQAARADDWKVTLVKEEPLIRGLFFLQLAFFCCVGVWELWARREERNQMFEIDRLAAAANIKQSRVSESISNEDDLGLSPALVARTRPDTPQPAPASPAPPTSSAPPPPSAAAPAPPRSTPPPPPPMPPGEAPAFSMPDRGSPPSFSFPTPPAAPAMPVMPATAAASAGGPSGESAGGWAELLHRVRSGDGDAPSDRPGVPKFNSPDESAETAGPKKPAFPLTPAPPASGGDAWEALLKKTAAPSGGLNFSGSGADAANPFSKMLTSSPAAAPGTNPFAKAGLPPGSSAEDMEPPRNPLADESVRKPAPNRSISLGFGSAEKPPAD